MYLFTHIMRYSFQDNGLQVNALCHTKKNVLQKWNLKPVCVSVQSSLSLPCEPVDSIKFVYVVCRLQSTISGCMDVQAKLSLCRSHTHWASFLCVMAHLFERNNIIPSGICIILYLYTQRKGNYKVNKYVFRGGNSAISILRAVLEWGKMSYSFSWRNRVK